MPQPLAPHARPGGMPAPKRPVSPAEPARHALERDLRAAVRGDVWFDRATRTVYARDASNYRQVPIGVVCPLDADDVAAAVRVCAAHGVPVLGRGAGTSLAGQGVNVAVIVDMARHMRTILEIDPERRLARVQPGVVLDDLRRAAEAFGLTFGPDPATHAWCTLGGMIGNNACGTHGLVAGKTIDNVAALDVITAEGARLRVTASGIAALDPHDHAAAGEAGRLERDLAALVARYEPAIRTGYPVLPRRVSGYDLDQLLPGPARHVARSLVGTESTCVLVTEATLHLVHLPPVRRLVVLGYGDVFAAADAVPGLLPHPLLGLEGFDTTLTDLMRARPLNVEHLALLPPGGAWLLAELGGETPAEADAAVDAFLAALPADLPFLRADEPEVQRRLWLVRESGLGAAAIRPDGVHNLEGWEDAAVPPERLGTYLRRLQRLWAEFGYSGAWYGHFGQGCVHTRNDFDLATPEGRAQYRAYVERAADLVAELGGSLSGEHGDGQARGELLARMYPPELIDAFRAFKRTWDPRWRMNPGKVIDANPLDADLDFEGGRAASPLLDPAAVPVLFALPRDHGSLQEATNRCVGVGRCRRDDAGTMCPSYRATRDERHGTRGRARLLEALLAGRLEPESWRNDEVRGALDLCLSCKGCAVDCPTGVDIATWKSQFMAGYYRGRRRPRADYAMGLLPRWARALTRLPRLANAVLAAPGARRVAALAGGLTPNRRLPRFAEHPWRRSATAAARRDRVDATVVVWPDTFTDAFRPAAGEEIVTLLEAAGEQVAIPTDWACCGRTLYDAGMLDTARGWLATLLDVLQPWIDRDIPVVVPEPSCLAAFRDELPSLLPDDPRALRLAGLARSASEHLIATGAWERLAADAGPARPAGTGPGADRPAVAAPPGTSIAIHPHCHARASRASGADAELARRLGYDVTVIDGGCCGLAGSFGFRAERDGLARQIGTEAWLPAVRAALDDGATTLVADGFSCRMQLDDLSGPRAMTLAGTLLAGAARTGTARAGTTPEGADPNEG